MRTRRREILGFGYSYDNVLIHTRASDRGLIEYDITGPSLPLASSAPVRYPVQETHVPVLPPQTVALPFAYGPSPPFVATHPFRLPSCGGRPRHRAVLSVPRGGIVGPVYGALGNNGKRSARARG